MQQPWSSRHTAKVHEPCQPPAKPSNEKDLPSSPRGSSRCHAPPQTKATFPSVMETFQRSGPPRRHARLAQKWRAGCLPMSPQVRWGREAMDLPCEPRCAHLTFLPRNYQFPWFALSLGLGMVASTLVYGVKKLLPDRKYQSLLPQDLKSLLSLLPMEVGANWGFSLY